MANKKRNIKIKPVYNRKILRNILKKNVGSNRIQKAWHYLQKTDWGKNKSEQRI